MINFSSSILVFLADDDANDRILFKDAIDQLDKNIRLKMFDEGSTLVKHLADFENEIPDFLFLDLNMPKKNGVECLEEIRRNDNLKNIHVIIYSTSSHLDDINETLNKGANLYFSKSSTFQELVNRLNRIFEMNWDEFNPARSIDKFVLLDEVGL